VPVVVTLTSARSLGDLKDRIADELARSDLTSQIALAIDDAIDEAATHRFWFNEVRGLTFPITAGTEYYANEDLSALTEVDDLWLTVGTQRRNMRQANDADLDRMNDGTQSRGEPYLWSRYADGFRFYPVPQQSYTATVDGVTRFPPLADDANSNAWMVQGERLIRAIAKRNLYAEVIRDQEEAQTQDALAVRFRNELLAQTSDRIGTRQMACNG
jgi:hypothetical protein